MEITVSGRHIEVTPAIKEYAAKRVGKLSKYFVGTDKIHVTLNVEGQRHWAELIITPRRGAPLIVAAETDNMYATIDVVADKAEARLTRYKEKLYGRRSKGKQVPAEATGLPRAVPSNLGDLGEGHMKLLQFISVDAIVSDLKATDKEAVLTEMVQSMVGAGRLEKGSLKGVVKSLLRREELGSTGVGRGVAVPHAKHGSVKEVTGTLAVSRAGVNFDALDGEPTYIFFLLLAPTDSKSSADYLEALGRISTAIRDERFCRFVRQARDEGELAELLKEFDEAN